MHRETIAIHGGYDTAALSTGVPSTLAWWRNQARENTRRDGRKRPEEHPLFLDQPAYDVFGFQCVHSGEAQIAMRSTSSSAISS